ncbi:hypothetical protein FGO68_gene5737 [Halteria grandinella]|uniref:Uncharacterized protein n=1 Tax=Halteria grandinella TaxID=5974 RepID=A0A8J8NEN1_HALGN|nr:hypothetical protein FGO68_gene5737 [Halteria grandinella]
MWKIISKYPLIELLSYLEYNHSMTLLFRISKGLRHRLTNSFKFIKNMQTPCYLKPDAPDKIFINKSYAQFYQKNLNNFKLSI